MSRATIEAEITRRGLQGGERSATLHVQGIGRDFWASGATVSLDWVDLFEGDHPRTRRRLRAQTDWNDRLFPDLEAAERRIRGLGFDRVMVRGAMRLAAWFATGVAFGHTRGMRVACMQGGARWETGVTPAKFGLSAPEVVDLGAGDELAVGLSVTNALAKEVLAHLRAEGVSVRRFVHVAVPAPGMTAIPDVAAAMGWALAARDVVREQALAIGARKVHLFMSGPAGGALFLGHVWNRVPTTQVYEDMNPGYAPAFLVP